MTDAPKTAGPNIAAPAPAAARRDPLALIVRFQSVIGLRRDEHTVKDESQWEKETGVSGSLKLSTQPSVGGEANTSPLTAALSMPVPT